MLDKSSPTDSTGQESIPHEHLRIVDFVTGYGKKQVLNGVSLEVYHGEIVALIGHNGAGKSTLLKVIFGQIPIWQGQLFVDGQAVSEPKPRKLLQCSVSYVPQGNRVFRDLTVYENLEMGGITLPSKLMLDEGIERVLTLFPALKNHMKQRAGTLSGGEKQMLALANALILSPKALLLDEPSLGLAPSLISDTFERIQQISKESRTTILIVEQKVREVLQIAQRVYVLRNGRVSFSGSTEELKDDAKLKEVYL